MNKTLMQQSNDGNFPLDKTFYHVERICSINFFLDKINI